MFSVCLRLMTQKTQQTGGNSGWQKFLWEKIDKVLTGFFAIGLQRENNGNCWTILTKFMKIPPSLRTFLKFRQNIYIFKLSDNNNSQGYCYGRLPDTNSLENKKNQIKTQMWTIGVFMLKEEMENSLISPLICIVSINFP